MPIDDGAAFAVDVRYSGNPRPAPSTWGPVGWEELADGILVASQPSGAATWFPCNDLPSQKAPFRIGVTAASGYHVVSNGRLDSGRVRGSRTTWVYEQAEPMAPYLATLHIGRYQDIDVSASPVAIRATLPATLVPAFEVAFARQAEMVEVFSERFGPYPFDAGYRVVVTGDPLEIPLEAQGMAVFGVNHLDGTHERLIAHELAHQWFGNCVTAASWRDIWLHEGLRLLRRVGVVRGIGRTPGRAACAPTTTPGSPPCRRTSCSATRVPRTCSTTASTSAAPSRCTPCASVSATRRSSSCCGAG